jgi:hypothetical protein
MTKLERFHLLATVLAKEAPQLPVTPMPWHACHHHRGFSYCRFCGNLYTDGAAMRCHHAQYCCTIGG